MYVSEFYPIPRLVLRRACVTDENERDKFEDLHKSINVRALAIVLCSYAHT